MPLQKRLYQRQQLQNAYADEDEATVYTANPAWIRKMDKLHREFSGNNPVKVMDGSKQDLCFAKKPCQDWKTKSFK